MNNTEKTTHKSFDFTRFGRLLKHDLRTIWPLYGLSLILLIGAPLLLWIFSVNFGDNVYSVVPISLRWSIILFLTVLSGCIAPSKLFSTSNLPQQGIYFAMLPASKFEKYLSMIIIGLIVCPLICLVGGIVLDSILTLLPIGGYRESLFSVHHILDLWKEGSEEKLAIVSMMKNPIPWILLYISVAVIFLFANTIFKKHKFIKTILWIIIIQFLFSWIIGIIFSVLDLNGGLMEILARRLENWTQNLVDDPITHLRRIFVIINLWLAIFTGVLGWWTWHRLKKMEY